MIYSNKVCRRFRQVIVIVGIIIEDLLRKLRLVSINIFIYLLNIHRRDKINLYITIINMSRSSQ